MLKHVPENLNDISDRYMLGLLRQAPLFRGGEG